MFWILFNLLSAIVNLFISDGWGFNMIVGVLNVFAFGLLLGKEI